MKYYKLNEISKESIRILGRTTGQIDPLVLFWHGSGIEMNVKASDFFVEFEAEYSLMEFWIGIWIDGSLINRQVVSRGKSTVPVFLNCNPDDVHHIQVIKETQPIGSDSEGLLKITGVSTDGIFVPLSDYKMKIEFIGDSITSGEGTVGAKNEMAWNPMVMSTSYAYPFLTGQSLNASVRMISQGGWGVYIGWDGNRDSNIPSIYKEVCSVLKYSKAVSAGSLVPNDFNSWQPDIIFVNLGTNDNSAVKDSFNKKTTAPVLDAVDNFLDMLRDHNPNSIIIWGYGAYPGELHEFIGKRVREYAENKGDKNIKALKLPTFSEEEAGSRNHPGRLWHRRVAQLLTEEFNELIKSLV